MHAASKVHAGRTMLRRRGARTSEAPRAQVVRASVRRRAAMVQALVPVDLVAVLVNAVLVIAHHRPAVPVVLAIGHFRVVRIEVQAVLAVRA